MNTKSDLRVCTFAFIDGTKVVSRLAATKLVQSKKNLPRMGQVLLIVRMEKVTL
jgi:hypothetical protein